MLSVSLSTCVSRITGTDSCCWMQVVSDPALAKSGTYWSWKNETGSFEGTLSDKASDAANAAKLWDLSEKLVGLQH